MGSQPAFFLALTLLCSLPGEKEWGVHALLYRAAGRLVSGFLPALEDAGSWTDVLFKRPTASCLLLLAFAVGSDAQISV